MALICKKCGYKQHDDETINYLKGRHPETEEHDIPYYCGACLDTASDQDRIDMENEMHGLKCPLGGDETDDCAGCAYSGEFHFVNGECICRENTQKDGE